MPESQTTTPQESASFGDFIVYGDESGDHGLVTMEPTYPLFVLTFCIFKKSDYTEIAAPEFQKFKFRQFGHDMVILHESDIRKARSDFGFLTDKLRRDAFLGDLSETIARTPFTVIACAIRKDKLQAAFARTENPYHLALTFCLERLHEFLASREQRDKLTHVVVERRGKKEDDDLELEFRRIRAGKNYNQTPLPFALVFGDKK